jgi:hypothetical protein
MCLNHYGYISFDIYLVVILGFYDFSFCHIYFLRFGVIFNNWLNLKI